MGDKWSNSPNLNKKEKQTETLGPEKDFETFFFIFLFDKDIIRIFCTLFMLNQFIYLQMHLSITSHFQISTFPDFETFFLSSCLHFIYVDP